MTVLPTAKARADYWPWLPASAATAFLFVGFVKGLVPSPVDLTVLAAAALCLTLVPYRRELAAGATNPLFVILAALAVWLALRLLPDVPAWGLRKLAELVAFGAPALAAGYIVARDDDVRDALARLLAYAGVPVSAAVVLGAALGNPYSFSWVGSGGYQMTGLFLGLSMVASATLRNPLLFGVAALGAAVTGHLSGALFAGLAAVAIWSMNRDWRTALHSSIVAGGLWMTYAVVIAPPLIFMRLLWKSGGVLLVWLGQPGTPEEAAAQLDRTVVGSTLNSVLRAMPAESRNYLVEYGAADRLDFYWQALKQFFDKPLAGWGYGTFHVAGNTYPHNIVLELAAETGIVGAGLVVAALVLASRAAWKSRDPLIIGTCSIVFLTAMVSGYFGGRILMFAFGLAAGATYGKR